MRLLSLVVSIRRSAGGMAFKGDLSARVQTALRTLIASKSVINTDGVYSLLTVSPVVA